MPGHSAKLNYIYCAPLSPVFFLSINTKAGTLESLLAARLDAIEAKFVADLDAYTKEQTAELEQLRTEQEEATKATEAKLKEAVDAVQFGVVVAPGDDIAAVVKEMADEGGKIFLKRGIHELSETLIIDKPITFIGAYLAP